MKIHIRSLLLACVVLVSIATNARSQDAPEKYGWSFRNFGTPVYYWDIYRNSMFGIPQDSSGLTAPFDLLFYSLCFRDKLGTSGNCYGLGLLSLVMNNDGGHLGFCCPTNFYGGTSGVGPTDPKLLRAINIMHGHQVTLACLQVFFDQFLNGHSQNATFVTPIAQQTLDKEGAFLVSITKSLSPSDGGHTLIAYKMTNLGGSHYRIWVVDPNRIWADSVTPDNRDFYTTNKNYIDCNGATWKYDMGGSLGIWPTGSGHLTVLPVSVAEPTGRVPSSLGLAVGDLLNKIFIAHNGEGATIEQITSNGKRLFLPGTKQVDWSATTGLRSMAPFFPSDAPTDGKPFQFELYYNIGALRSAEITFNSGTAGASIAMGDNTGYALVDCRDPQVHPTVKFSGIGTASPVAQISASSKPIHCDVTLLIPTVAGKTNRTFTVHDIEVPAGSTAEVAIDGGRSIVVRGTSGQGASFVVSQQSLDANDNFATEPILVTPKYESRWSQEDWMRLRQSTVPQLTGR